MYFFSVLSVNICNGGAKGHEPSPVQAVYGGYVCKFNIVTGEMIEGDLPLKAKKTCQEMAVTLLFRASEDVERSGYHKTPSSCVRL